MTDEAKDPQPGRYWKCRRRLSRVLPVTLGIFAAGFLFSRRRPADAYRLDDDRHEDSAEADCPWCRSLQQAEERAAG